MATFIDALLGAVIKDEDGHPYIEKQITPDIKVRLTIYSQIEPRKFVQGLLSSDAAKKIEAVLEQIKGLLPADAPAAPAEPK